MSIVETHWAPGTPGQRFEGNGLAPTRVFPECDKPSFMTTSVLHDKVDIQVVISAAGCGREAAIVHLRAFDPDHAFNPATTAEVNSHLDPNDAAGDLNAEDNIPAWAFSRPVEPGWPSPAANGGGVLDDRDIRIRSG